jgi:hypothetical protein
MLSTIAFLIHFNLSGKGHRCHCFPSTCAVRIFLVITTMLGRIARCLEVRRGVRVDLFIEEQLSVAKCRIKSRINRL